MAKWIVGSELCERMMKRKDRGLGILSVFLEKGMVVDDRYLLIREVKSYLERL